MNAMASVIGRGLLATGLLISTGPMLAAGSDDGFAAFWTQFKTAVGKSDQTAVLQMVKDPVFYIEDRKAADFPVVWKGAFKPAQRTCLARQKPMKDTHDGKVSYATDCGHLIYSFGNENGGWKLTSIDEAD